MRALGARRARLGRPASPAALQPLVTVCAASRYLADHLAARPRLLDLLPMLSGMTRTASETLATGFRLANAPDAEAFARGLRRHKLVEMLRIALRDLTGRAPLPESARELSFLASSVLEAAVRFHYRRLCAQHGAPEGRTAAGPSGFCVLGMGKLGGTELNFSSDVDLLYVYGRDGPLLKYDCRDAGTQAGLFGIADPQAHDVGDQIEWTRLHRFLLGRCSPDNGQPPSDAIKEAQDEAWAIGRNRTSIIPRKDDL